MESRIVLEKLFWLSVFIFGELPRLTCSEYSTYAVPVFGFGEEINIIHHHDLVGRRHEVFQRVGHHDEVGIGTVAWLDEGAIFKESLNVRELEQGGGGGGHDDDRRFQV